MTASKPATANTSAIPAAAPAATSSDASARESVLGAIRGALRRGPLDDARRAELDARVPGHTRITFDEALLERFVRKFEGRSGSVVRVGTLTEVPRAVADYVREKGLPPRVAIGRALAHLSWPDDWHIEHGAAGIDETLAVSPSICAIAEMGSLMLGASPDSPTTHNFVPDDHIVVLEANRVVAHYEDAWSLLRALPGGMPRATNLISGPSRTADVEQTIQLGAHGPRRVHVIIVGGI